MFKKLIHAWQSRSTLGDEKLQTQELDFLPAALEIQERPPHPLGRITSWLLIILFTIAVIWACFGQVNIVATAEGKIVPYGQVKQIQPYERGVVAEILVTEGQLVKQGDPLIVLDRTQTGADLHRMTQEVHQNRLNAERTRYFVELLNQQFKADAIPQVNWPARITKAERATQTSLLKQQVAVFRAEMYRLDQRILDKDAERNMNKAVISKLQSTLPLISQRVDAVSSLMAKKMAARVQYLELEQERVEQKHDLVSAKARAAQLAAQLEELRQQQHSLLAQTRSDNLQQLIEYDRQFASMSEELNKARDLNHKQVLHAPVNGVVQELAVHTIGGVVTPAQELMKIIPENQQLMVEAWLENKDIGFVHQGQNSEIKIHTFPFTKYGIIDAQVDNVSSDAVADEQRGLIYKTRLLMDKKSLWVDGREVDLVPGMSVTAEMKTGKRYLIEFILTPLLRYKNESVRER
ncbi:HlyD family type I secretion periplasmic adaptor subunit [Amphritea balenae]|uniref:Membrane fusion protein (MFP) family protein n=1 Tax=Amphritea balenae TaxID=452629 RepID=A0A3P1SKI5_9GAMM|nr:HlyD family type I secretion periplasmic adaptor subunit [Amphritea balenae]RRC96822.1 HlyD family type I secretion periplasmic adaptor subunit [Amphritea balenae]GGK61463.1 HlyD family type I secretion periplasmic adaptor subunit [Amphritea balenae]